MLRWTVQRNGKPSGIRKVRSSLRDAPLEKCVASAVERARFSRPEKKPATVRVPFDLRPSRR